MEVREIIETTVKEPIIEIKFRLATDSDEVMRTVEFQLDEIEEYGYNILTEDFDLFDINDDWENDEFDYLDDYDDDDDELNIDEEELIAFMNEYFLINNRVPPAELF
jgi:hypothetical protein